MSIPSLFVLALGLAMDAAAVAATCGLAAPTLRARHFVVVAAWFGGFQATMPLLGWLLGTSIGPAVAAWDHWIAFALLLGIGAKLIHDAWIGGEGIVPRDANVFRVKIMVPLAVATSIDAAAVGITLPMLDTPLAPALLAIGLVTAACSAGGLALGRYLGARLGRGLDLAGGVVLVLLGTKILVQHLLAG